MYIKKNMERNGAMAKAKMVIAYADSCTLFRILNKNMIKTINMTAPTRKEIN